ncbi:MAG TPA: signal peptide peptidase SppA [Candidatus Tectomicrobia bacterium]
MHRKKRWIILALVVILVVVGVMLVTREPTIAPGSFLVLDLEGNYSEAPPTDLLGRLVGTQQRLFSDVLLELQKATVDARLQGVILKVEPLELDFAQVQELRDALRTLQTAGKRVIAWVTGEADSGNREYYLASVADKVYFAENTMLPLLGLRSTAIFLGGVWEKLDVDMQVEQIKEYKTFGDFLARKSMSEAYREMTNSLLDSLQEQFLGGIAAARGLSPAQVQALIDAPMLAPADFQQAGLIDGIQDFEAMLEHLGESPAAPISTVPLATYRRVKPTSVGLMRGPKIAVVYGVGAVTNGESDWSATGPSMGVDTLTEAFKEAAQDETIRAIVFRIDSPGGSALASDRIWQAVVHAKGKKPVVVSMAGVAASGGYYVAAGANKIVAQPGTLTGSIGIVFSQPNIQGLLARLGIATETLDRGRYARLFDASKGWSAAERQQVQRLLETLYRTFIRKVAEGRSLSVDEVDRLGRGRVWTGAQAHAYGLVDQLGGLETALRLAKEAAGIPTEASTQLVFYPTTESWLTTLVEFWRTQTGTLSALPQPLREFVRSLAPFVGQGYGPLLAPPFLLQVR